MPQSPRVAPSTPPAHLLLSSIIIVDTIISVHYSPPPTLQVEPTGTVTRMAPKDRTSEFHSTLASIKSRSSLPASSSSVGGKSKNEAKQPLIAKDSNGRSTPKNGSGSKSEFGRMAGGIAKDINSTTLKLQKLAQCMSSLRGPKRPKLTR